MLQFAAQNSIFPEIQLFEFSQINECIERMRKEKVGYRMVLKAPESWWETVYSSLVLRGRDLRHLEGPVLSEPVSLI